MHHLLISQPTLHPTLEFYLIHDTFQELKDLELRIKSDLDRLRAVGVRSLEDSGFEYGFNPDYLMTTIAPYWLKTYNWKKQENMLNDILPQFITSIDGLDIHFAHVKPDPLLSKDKKVLPLLMVHGWPGTILRNFFVLINISEF